MFQSNAKRSTQKNINIFRCDAKRFCPILQIVSRIHGAHCEGDTAALLSFAFELQQIPVRAPDENMQMIRYQWWHDALTDNEISTPLLHALHNSNFDKNKLVQMVECGGLCNTFDEVNAYAQNFYGSLTQLLAQQIYGELNQKQQTASMLAGSGIGLLSYADQYPDEMIIELKELHHTAATITEHIFVKDLLWHIHYYSSKLTRGKAVNSEKIPIRYILKRIL